MHYRSEGLRRAAAEKRNKLINDSANSRTKASRSGRAGAAGAGTRVKPTRRGPEPGAAASRPSPPPLAAVRGAGMEPRGASGRSGTHHADAAGQHQQPGHRQPGAQVLRAEESGGQPRRAAPGPSPATPPPTAAPLPAAGPGARPPTRRGGTGPRPPRSAAPPWPPAASPRLPGGPAAPPAGLERAAGAGRGAGPRGKAQFRAGPWTFPPEAALLRSGSSEGELRPRLVPVIRAPLGLLRVTPGW